jgi:hypothetical protein
MTRLTRGVSKNYSVQQIVQPLTAANSKEIVVNVNWNYKGSTKGHSVSSVVSTSTVN